MCLYVQAHVYIMLSSMLMLELWKAGTQLWAWDMESGLVIHGCERWSWSCTPSGALRLRPQRTALPGASGCHGMAPPARL